MAKVVQPKEEKGLKPETVHMLTVLGAEILITLLLALAVSYGFFTSILIQENSMSPTISSGDTVLLNRTAYFIGSPKRGDLIAYRIADRLDSAVYVKRVIGLPGETIEIRDGLILINDVTYMEDDDFPEIENAGLAEGGITLGSEEYFVLGDNRNASEDSRYADVGNISAGDILGRVWFRTSPKSAFGFVK